jgi:hypothetical protein
MKRFAVVRLGACAAVALAAACGSPGKTVSTARPEEAPEVVRRDAFPVVSTETILAIARDATHLYWADLTGVHRRPLGGPDAGGTKRLTDATAAWGNVAAMAVSGDRLYLSDGLSVTVMPAAGGELEEVSLDGLAVGQIVVALAGIGDGDAIVATAGEIVRLPRGGRPVVLAEGQVAVTSVAVDGEHVYWTDYGEDPASVPIAPGSYYYGGGDPSLYLDGPGVVRRVALSGGAVAELATSQRGPSSVAVWDGRIWWASDRGPGVQSAPVAGGEARVEVRGRFDRLARDGRGLVAKNASGLVTEWSGPNGATTGEVRMTADGRWLPAWGKPLLLTDEWVYLVAMHPYEARNAVFALPRQDEAVDVVAAVDESIVRVRVRDGVVWWLASMRGTPGLAISQRDPSSGEVRRLATHEGWVTDVAVGDRELYFSEDASIYRVTSRGLSRFATSNSYAVALTVHRNHVFWCDNNQLMAKKRKGGQPFLVTQFAPYGNAEAGSDLVFDDDFAYLIAYGGEAQSIFRISERGDVASVWSTANTQVYPQRDLVSVGGELYFAGANNATGAPAIYRLGSDGDGSLVQPLGSGGDRYVSELVAGGGFLYVTLVVNDTVELVRVEPSSGELKTVLRWQGYPNEPGLLAADETGAYLGIEPYDAVIRIAHDAPGLPEPIRFGGM